MPMTVIVVRDVPPRFRGFLASVMLEIAPCVYTGPRLSRTVRERVWRVLADWHGRVRQGGIVMTWQDGSLPGGQGVATLGVPPRWLVEHDGVFLSHQRLLGDGDWRGNDVD